MAVPDYRRETIHVGDLKLGMFVSDLDRPWLDSPFMMQGFLLEEDEQIQQLQSLCKTVIIDRTLSSSEHQVEIPKESVAFTRDGTITTRKAAVSQRPIKSSTEKVSFFDILRELSSSKDEPGKPPSAQTEPSGREKSTSPSSTQQIPTKQTHSKETAGAINDAYQNTDHQHSSIGSQLKHDMSSVLGKVKGWLPGTKKLRLFGGSTTDTDSSNDSNNTANSYSITIFEDSVPVEEEMAIIYPVFEKTQIATREIFEAIASENKIDLMQVNQTLDSMVESIERNPDALMWLAKLKQRDDYAYNHALNVSINLMALAHFMALPKAQIKDLGLAGLLQDIGKVKIPTKLLHKEAQLSPAEFIEIKTHVKHGLDILRQTDNMSQNVLNIVANHHERIDGSGYPSKLELKQISLAAQMAGIMDTYCALTSNKPYAKGIFNQHALEQIYASRDKEFSGVLVNQLIQFFGIYPVSSLVELNSGEVAVVIQQNRVRRLQPRVVILLAPDKTKNQYPVTLDLINSPPSPNGEPYKITRGLPPDSYGLNPADFYL